MTTSTSKQYTGVRPHGSGIQIDFQYQDKRYREKVALAPTEANLKHADRIRQAILNDIAFNRLDLSKYFPNRKIHHSANLNLIGDAFDDFLKFKRTSCALSTVRDYQSAIDFHLRPIFGSLPFDEIKPTFIRNWLADLPISLKRKNNILIPLREVFNAAYRDGLISENPLTRIENFKHATPEPHPFRRDEIEQILKAATGQIRNLFEFAFFSGLRTSELIALRWEDVDLNRDIAFIRQAKVRKVIKTTKTEAGLRTIKLLPPAKNALVNQKEFKSISFSEIFLNPKTLAPWVSDGQIRKTAWYPLLKLANVQQRNPYQTRHTFASLMLTAGEEPFWVSQQMGHKNLQMTLKRYARWIEDIDSRGGDKFMQVWSHLGHKENASD